MVRTGEPRVLAGVLRDAFPGVRIIEREGEAWVYERSLRISDVAAALERGGVGFEYIERAKPSLEQAYMGAVS